MPVTYNEKDRGQEAPVLCVALRVPKNPTRPALDARPGYVVTLRLQHTIDVHYFAAEVFVTRVDIAGVGARPRVYRVVVVAIVGVDRIATSAPVDYVHVAAATSGVYGVGTPMTVYHVGRPVGGPLVDYIGVVGAVTGQIGTREGACQRHSGEQHRQKRHRPT